MPLVMRAKCRCALKIYKNVLRCFFFVLQLLENEVSTLKLKYQKPFSNVETPSIFSEYEIKSDIKTKNPSSAHHIH